MQSLIIKRIKALCCWILCFPLPAFSEIIEFGVNESPPYWSSTLPEQGLGAELLQAISAVAQLQSRITFKPLKRLIEEPHNNDLGNPIFYLSEQSYASIIPIALYHIAFYYYQPNFPDKPPSLRSINDLQQYKIGILQGTLIDRLAFEQLNIHFETSYERSSIFKKLKLGRIDLALVIKLVGEQVTQQLYPEQSENFIAIPLPNSAAPIAIMLDENLPGAKVLNEQYRLGLKYIIEKGIYQKILQKYYLNTPIPDNWFSDLQRFDNLYNFEITE